MLRRLARSHVRRYFLLAMLVRCGIKLPAMQDYSARGVYRRARKLRETCQADGFGIPMADRVSADHGWRYRFTGRVLSAGMPQDYIRSVPNISVSWREAI